MSKFELANVTESQFQSPIYEVLRVPVWCLVAQPFNPNSLNSKSFAALQTSIKNAGYAMCITACENQVYDPAVAESLTPFDRIKMHIEGADNDAKSGTVTGDLAYATQISDTNMRRAFQYEIVDGSQRSGVIRMGTYLFMQKSTEEQENLANKWANGEDIPENPGKEMLMYLAWRERFSVPCSILKGKTDAEKMSATILFNTARGSHSLDSMKDIVSQLITVAGCSEDWVAKNLFMDLDTVKRMTQLSGLKKAYDKIDNASLAWNPLEDKSFERKQRGYLNREASKYVSSYMANHPDENTNDRDMGDLVEYAKSLGFDENAALNEYVG